MSEWRPCRLVPVPSPVFDDDIPTALEVQEVARQLLVFLHDQGPLLPANPNLLIALWDRSLNTPSEKALREAIALLIREKYAHKCIVGHDSHLLLAGDVDISQMPSVVAAPAPPPARRRQPSLSQTNYEEQDIQEKPPEDESLERKFELEVSIDVEKERILLYRSLIALGIIAGLVLLREVALFFFGL